MHISSEFCILDEMQDNKTAREKLLKILLLLLLYAQLHCICMPCPSCNKKYNPTNSILFAYSSGRHAYTLHRVEYTQSLIFLNDTY